MTNKQTVLCVPVLMILAIHREKCKRREAAFRRYWKGRKLSDYSPERTKQLREACGFTEEEAAVFDLRAKGKSIVEIGLALRMAEATVNRRIRTVKRKIYRTR